MQRLVRLVSFFVFCALWSTTTATAETAGTDLAVSLSAGSTTEAAGLQLPLVATVRNLGPAPGEKLAVEFTLSRDVAPLADPLSGTWSCQLAGARVVRCTLASLPALAVSTIELAITTSVSEEPFSASVQLTSETQDAGTDNNSARISILLTESARLSGGGFGCTAASPRRNASPVGLLVLASAMVALCLRFRKARFAALRKGTLFVGVGAVLSVLLSGCAAEEVASTARIEVTVEGAGSVTSTPQGISCGTSCASSFPSGQVQLIAEPAERNRFAGWSGACDGLLPICTLALRGDVKVGARFVELAPTCTDKLRNGTETDVDCGGSCRPCAQDQACTKDSDCSTLLCTSSRCAVCPLVGPELAQNGGAESGTAATSDAQLVAVPGWTTTGGFTVLTYGAIGGYPTQADPGPAMRGTKFFIGGTLTPSTATQTVDLSACPTLIDSNQVSLNLSGYLGGFATQADNVTLTAQLSDGTNPLGQLVLGPVTPADRTNLTGMLARQGKLLLPSGTRRIVLTLLMTRLEGAANDGYADNISAVLSTN